MRTIDKGEAFVMDGTATTSRQATPRRTAAPMLSPAEQVMIVTARGAVTDALNLLHDGRPVAAREALEWLFDTYSDAQVSDGMERQMLYDLPPVWLVDSYLHRRRRDALEHYLPGGTFNEHGIFEFREPGTGFWTRVHPNDCWGGTFTGGQDFVQGDGLTGLIGLITGEGLAGTVARLARKIGIEGPGHD